MSEQQTTQDVEAQVAAALDEVPAEAPVVGIVMASSADMDVMDGAAAVLREQGIPHEVRVLGLRQPDLVADYCRNARMRGLRAIIAGAGLAATLPAVAAAHTDLPVIGVPLSSPMSALGGLDAVLSVVQAPPGLPVACVGLDNANNAGHLAARIVAL